MANLTYKETAGRILSRIGEKVDEVVVRGEIDNVYRELTTNHPWSLKKTFSQFTTTAAYTTGTVDMTNANTTVSGTNTTFTSSMAGRLLIVGTYPNLISAYVSGTELTLTAGYAGDTDTGLTYSINQHEYELASGVSHLLTIKDQYELDEMAADVIERIDPLRQATGEPTHFIYKGWGSNNGRVIELWPTPTATYTFSYTGLTIGALTISTSSTEIENILYSIVLNLASSKVCHTLANLEKDTFWLQSADRYERDGQLALQNAAWMDLTAFGAPKVQRYTGNDVLYSDNFLSDHDVDF